MTCEEGAPLAGSASKRPGGPVLSIPATPDMFTPCGCVESDLIWAILSGDAPPPSTAGWRAMLHFADALVLRRLAAIRPLLVASDMDALIPNRFAQLEVLRANFEIPTWARSGNAMLAQRRREVTE